MIFSMKANGFSSPLLTGIASLNPVLRCLGSLLLLASQSGAAKEYYFSPSALEGEALHQQAIDLSLFSNANAQMPGMYLSRIKVNDTSQDDATLSYRPSLI